MIHPSTLLTIYLIGFIVKRNSCQSKIWSKTQLNKVKGAKYCLANKTNGVTLFNCLLMVWMCRGCICEDFITLSI